MAPKASNTTINTNKNFQIQPKQIEQPVDIHFDSDSDEEQKHTEIKKRMIQKSTQIEAQTVNKNQWQQDENDKNTVDDQSRGPSKLLQKYYKK